MWRMSAVHYRTAKVNWFTNSLDNQMISVRCVNIIYTERKM